MKEKRISFAANLRLGLHFFRFRFVQKSKLASLYLISIKKCAKCFDNMFWQSRMSSIKICDRIEYQELLEFINYKNVQINV